MRRARTSSAIAIGALALTIGCGETARRTVVEPDAPGRIMDYDGCTRLDLYCNPVPLDSYERSHALNMASQFSLSLDWRCYDIGNAMTEAINNGTALTYDNPAPPGHPDHMDVGDYHPTGMGTSMDGQIHIDRDHLLDPGVWGHEVVHKRWHNDVQSADPAVQEQIETEAQAIGWQCASEVNWG